MLAIEWWYPVIGDAGWRPWTRSIRITRKSIWIRVNAWHERISQCPPVLAAMAQVSESLKDGSALDAGSAD